MRSSLLWRSSVRYLFTHPLLTGLSILGVALGVAVVVGIDLANVSSERAFRLSSSLVTGTATHQIVGAGNELDDTLYAELRVEYGFRKAAPVVEGYASYGGESEGTLQVLGVDLLAESSFRSFIGGAQSSLDLGQFMGPSSVGLLSEETALSLGIELGDTLKINISGIPHEVVLLDFVRGLSDLDKQAMSNLLVVDIGTAQRLFSGAGKLSRIDLIISPEEIDQGRLSSLENWLPSNVRLQKASSRGNALDQMTKAFTLNLQALSLLALVVGMFLIYNIMTFSVVQRAPTIGRFRALGVTQKEIYGTIISESLIIGVSGTVLGLLGGVMLGNGLVNLVSQTINDLYFVLEVRELTLAPFTLLKGAILGVGMTLVASLLPAREATTAATTTVLRRSSDETRMAAALPRLIWTSLGAAVVALLLLVVPGKSLILSYLALLLVLLSFALMTPPAVTLCTRWIRPVLGKMGGVVGKMAARGVETSLSRTGVAIAALMIAISSTIGVGVMVESFRGTVDQWLSYTLSADVYISPPSPVFRRNDATIIQDVERDIRALDGISGAYAVRTAQVQMNDFQNDLIIVDPRPGPTESYRFKEGDIASISERFASDNVVKISEPFSYRHDIHAGDTLQINTDNGRIPFEVAAVYFDYASDVGAVMISRNVYNRHFDDPFVSGIALVASPGTDIDNLIERVQQVVGGRQEVFIRSNRSLRQASLDVFDRTFTITQVLRLLAVLIAFVGVLSALMALQLERGKELAIMRANGLTPRQVWLYVTTQTGLMGLLAGLFAVPLGLILAYVLVFVINKRSFGWTLQMDYSPDVLLQAVVLAIIAALLAGIYPAMKMASANPVSALRED
ncbi:MAG: ABC transporter permease [Bacteroidetes Order II. Incertae sedis bacterium]|jgi:putative ABC transport system permease protein|nr:ABC transporter permease [Bacteroidetes Order II. bacterium]MBT4602962.1 ABC transporter permease [Bacteroidetes Order II. bacterium]MBT5248963.1 ABC transporter permease [Bacteroidetes Order II. bacterium]MBT6200934.1 ABC transporter permease [Bacteroidetes Order II. bacterium]MBT6424033.1 ABC transporter permease [Bacteroidetes Order II. bacterium]